MNLTDRIILAGLANNKTSLGEVFRRYIECFKHFSNPDIYDIGQFTTNPEVKIDFYISYNGVIDHNIKYIHSTFHLYNELISKTRRKKTCCYQPTKNKKIGYFVWESSELPPEYIGVLSDFDEIWTASEFCQNVFSQYINSENIKIINHPIPFPLIKYEKYKKMTILIIGNISSDLNRKNILKSIQVANIIKEKNPEIDIILKTFTISPEERTLVENIKKDYDLRVINEYYTSFQLQELIAKSHIILSMHRSEGFGLCLAEGIPFGTIPLATGYSGNLDFMRDTRLLIDYKLVDTKHPYFKGQWAEPSLDDAIDKLTHIITHYNSLDYDFSNITNYSFEKVANIIKYTL